ncbi:hypothetical protein [Nostoc sp. C057]|uniref:hypothetical protein n=1 Tax=Nostoc sp. C057 TaxID=2576903 RepID=UPI0015C2EAB4|nr:hypothetical protein [Nostoc sp. C057]
MNLHKMLLGCNCIKPSISKAVQMVANSERCDNVVVSLGHWVWWFTSWWWWRFK